VAGGGEGEGDRLKYEIVADAKKEFVDCGGEGGLAAAAGFGEVGDFEGLEGGGDHRLKREVNPDVKEGLAGEGGRGGVERFSRGDLRFSRHEVRFSRGELRQFIENQQYDISMTGQIRFVICRMGGCPADNSHLIGGCRNSGLVGGESHRGSGIMGGRPTAGSYIVGETGCSGASGRGGGMGLVSACEKGRSVAPIQVGGGGDFGDERVGFIDIFDFDPANSTAGVGVLICDEGDRRRGYASEAVEILCRYAKNVLKIRQLWCTVAADNFSSAALFRGKDFVMDERMGLRSRVGEVGGGETGCGEIFFRKNL
jgi:ribosomal protein S18 acetylase RimI-like enzyme